MAHKISQVSGRAEAMYAITPAWHGLGVTVDHAPTSREAFKLAGLDWDVETRELFFAGIGDNGQPTYNPVADRVATVRTDNGLCLGVVGKQYKVVQNSELFTWCDQLVGSGDVRYESAGALKDGRIVCELDDLVITRTFTAAGGGSLTVANKEGAKYSSPQAVLDKLVGKMSFDPLAFARMAPKSQGETLRQLVGLDFTKLDADRRALFDKRTAVNGMVKTLEGQLAGVPFHADAPPAEVSVAGLSDQLGAMRDHNAEIDRLKTEHSQAMTRVNAASKEIARLEEALAEARKDQETHARHADGVLKQIESKRVADLTPIQQQIAGAEVANRKVRDNARRSELALKLDDTREESDTLTKQIESIDGMKANALADAPFPVPGLGFSETGVTLKGLPFSQASSAEQLRVSVAMGLAMNPALKVLLIRDGSLLDDASLKIVAEMAEQADGQVWVERVTNGEAVGIVIEDGAVK